MTSTISQCLKCKHYQGAIKCKAFKIIPPNIYNNKHDHRKPYPGDNGIQFEPIEKKEGNG